MRLLNLCAATALVAVALNYVEHHKTETDAMSVKIRVGLTQILHKSAGIWDARVRKNIVWGE